MGDQQRTLNWSGSYNIRDLGGLPLANGGVTEMGRLIRADSSCRLNGDGIEALKAYGVRTVIDLRAPHEIEKDPSPFETLDWDGVYANRPLEKFYPHVGEMIRGAKHRGEVYCIILDHYPEMLAAAMRTILAGSDAGVLFHCHSGTDRTGTIAGLLLKLAGVPDQVIVDDYAESQINLRPHYGHKWKDPNDETVSFWARPTATGDMMQHMLDHVEAKYGGVQAYLAVAGLKEEEIQRLRLILSG